MKEIKVTPADLKEIEEDEFAVGGIMSTKLDGQLKKVLDIVKQRKFTTHATIMNKLSLTRRSARNLCDALREKGFVDKQYALIKCADSVARKTALYYEVNKKNGKERNNRCDKWIF